MQGKIGCIPTHALAYNDECEAASQVYIQLLGHLCTHKGQTKAAGFVGDLDLLTTTISHSTFHSFSSSLIVL